MQIQFLGAAGTVTGSQYLLTGNSDSLLIDAGLFQGAREWRRKNWAQPPFQVDKISAVLVTHAHIDHIGLLPRLYRLGLRAPIYCSEPTLELAKIMLLDSAELQEEEAHFRRKTGRSRYENPEPLYRVKDVEGVLKLFRGCMCAMPVEVTNTFSASFSQMGHILGSSSVSIEGEGKRLTFSGDVGRYGVPILADPEAIEFGDMLLIESTYGDRQHTHEDAAALLAAAISETAARKGAVLIPSFSVGRAQLLLYYIRLLKAARRIPDIPIIVDSPMAIDATSIYRKYPDWYDSETRALFDAGVKPFDCPKLYFTKSRDESKKLNDINEAMVIIAGNGMLSGGRVLHHLFHRISDPSNTVLFVGHQPSGGRGQWLLTGASSIRIMAQEVPVRAAVREIPGLSAHADKSELLQWCRQSKSIPGKVFVTHGEPLSAQHFANTLKKELGWNVSVATYLQKIEV